MVRLRAVILIAVVASGCIPVSEPLEDAGHATLERGLLGKWQVNDEQGRTLTLTVDRPKVPGNPNGMMRVAWSEGNRSYRHWFTTSTHGKHTYLTVFLEVKGTGPADFSQAGAFEKWQKSKQAKSHGIYHYALDGDICTLFEAKADLDLAALARGVDMPRPKPIAKKQGVWQTPEGWLATLFADQGPEPLFDRKRKHVLQRLKE